MEKYNTYGGTDAVERRIDLAKNFRSHENIFGRYELLVLPNYDRRGSGAQIIRRRNPLFLAESLRMHRRIGLEETVELQLLDVSKDTLSASESDEDEGGDPENNERELDFIIPKD